MLILDLCFTDEPAPMTPLSTIVKSDVLDEMTLLVCDDGLRNAMYESVDRRRQRQRNKSILYIIITRYPEKNMLSKRNTLKTFFHECCTHI